MLPHRSLVDDVIEPFDERGLARLATDDSFLSAEPFPHLVIDDLFEPAALDRILHEWPAPEATGMRSYHDGKYVKHKSASTDRAQLGRNTQFFINRLSGPMFLEALEKLTHISGLIPDPYLRGGGLHVTRSGGTLAVHADFNKHFKFNLDRRLNLIIYLNHEWTEDHQGWLELWDRGMNSAVQRVLPVFNRTVIFATTDSSFHRQPEPIVGPPDLFRKSVALYYYSNGRPVEELSDRDPRATLWQERPGKSY